ncbi:hypothetical protein [Deinococcus sp. Leaf326]|uniref:hypothetical protein n=1 Tax=Deinococcus sp. Leaf326 TaxID=1736338 RepID=UPI0006FF2FDD|nr:hypothetical protein [Deinococcus sp. Leaf326]KQR27916.1 hypothetical protein ASF71_04815 [Deinococcus sp. Leaf326]
MKKALIAAAIAAASCSAGAQFVSGSSLNGVELGLSAGYASGLSFGSFVHVPNVAGPVGVRASVDYVRPSDALRDDVDVGAGTGLTLGTFGSYKSGGVATESGSQTLLGLDGTYSLGEIAPGVDATAYAGGRYGRFSATETYADSKRNSQTTTTNAFGIGAGAMVSYALAGNISLFGDVGLDHYFPSTLSNGTDAGTYAPGEPGYNDLRSRFAFPGTVVKAKIGVKLSY